MDLKRITTAGGGYPFGIALVAVASALLFPLRAVLPSTTIMLLYVPAVIVIARFSGVRPSATAALLSFLALDFLFIPPYYRLTIASLSEWLGLVVFLIVALVAGQQTGQMRRRESAAVRRQDELALLNTLSFRIATEKSVRAIAEFLVNQVTEVLGASRTALYVSREASATPVCLAQSGSPRPASGETALVGWVLRTSKGIGVPATPNVPYDQRLVSVGPAEAIPGVVAEGVYLPLQTTSGLEGVLFVLTPGGPPADDDTRLLAAVANLAASSLERQRLEEEAAHAEALREADRLKSTLVSSVSHELKTPLAAATARVTGLLEEDDTFQPDRVREELGEVAEDLVRLDSSIGDLLDFSRLESDAWQPHLEPCEVGDILGTVRSRLSARQRDRVRFDLAPDLPLVRADFAQLARAITNLVENALTYSGRSGVEVGARRQGDCVKLWVEDEGPGVPESEKPMVFEKFFRGTASASAPSGTGLGLAIAREIVRSHCGTLQIEDVTPQGARFVLTVPAVHEEIE